MKCGHVLLCMMLLAACGDQALPGPSKNNDTGSKLDKAAIDAGILPDPDATAFEGRYETRSELGTDKFCAVAQGGQNFAIGFLAVSGEASKCEGRGTAIVEGEKVRITLAGKTACAFDARFDGVELRFPGTIESGCASYCSERASLSGTHYFMVQPGDSGAKATLGRQIEKLCD